MIIENAEPTHGPPMVAPFKFPPTSYHALRGAMDLDVYMSVMSGHLEKEQSTRPRTSCRAPKIDSGFAALP